MTREVAESCTTIGGRIEVTRDERHRVYGTMAIERTRALEILCALPVGGSGHEDRRKTPQTATFLRSSDPTRPEERDLLRVAPEAFPGRYAD